MNFGKNYIDLIRELEQMPEHQTLEKIRHFGLSLHIFERNYIELLHHLKNHNNPRQSLDLFGQENRHLLHAYQAEITRFLHNYIASSLSLVDHTRNHFKDLYGKNNLFLDYQDQINNQFVNHPLSVFIKDLRQYFQHFQMPRLSSKLQYTKDAPDFVMSINIPLKDLSKYSGWHAKAKEYMSFFKEDIDLLKLIEDYHKHIVDFYNWFIKRQMKIHQKDIEKVELHKRKIRDNEMMRFIAEFMVNPKTIEEFEEELFRFYHEKDLNKIKTTQNNSVRIVEILQLLNNENLFDDKAKDLIRKMYEK